ncbi:serine hydrolase domain-containing protein [Luteimonas sp. RIT-PG2_3]
MPATAMIDRTCPRRGWLCRRALDACALLWMVTVLAALPVQASAAGAAVGTALDEGPNADTQAAAIEALMARHVTPGQPGAAVGVYRAGRIVYAKGFGVADLETGAPITPRTPFYVSSVSKQFTAFAIALLVQDGKVDLDADIRRYLPWFPDLGQAITTRDLVHHTNGLREQYELILLSGRDLRDLVTQAQLRQVIARQRELNFAPGTDFLYGNTAYTLMAEIVHAVSGKTLREFTSQRMFAPLRMVNTGFIDDCCEVTPGRAFHYDKLAGGGWKRMRSSAGGAGPDGLLTTIEDLAAWSGNFGHPRVGDKALIGMVTRGGTLRDGSPLHYGFGLFDLPQGGREAISHMGVDVNVMSYFVYYPAHDLGIAVLSNSDVEVVEVAMAVADLYLPPVPPASAPAGPAALRAPAATMLERLTGIYVAETRPALVLERDGAALRMRQIGDKAGQVLTLRDDGSFDTGKRPGEFFRATTAVDGGSAAVAALERVPVAGAATRYRRVPPMRGDAAAWQPLTGAYHSDELDVTYTFAVEDGRLVARLLWHDAPIVLVQVTAGRFDSAATTLRSGSVPYAFTFDIDAQGRADRVRMHSPRVRSIALTRVAP